MVSPPPRDAVPFFRRGNDHVGRSNVPIGVLRCVACNAGAFQAGIDIGKATGPVIVPFLTQGLAGTDVHHLATLRDTMSGWTSAKVGGKEPSHGHFEDGRLASTRRSRDHYVVIGIDQKLRHLGLEMVEGMKLGPPEMRDGWTEDGADRKHRSGIRRTAPGSQMMNSWLRTRTVGRWLVERVMNERALVALVLV